MSELRVRWKTEGLVTWLTLSRPEALNALGEAEARQFAAALPKIAKEKSRVVVLTGEGKAFCSGGDMAFIEANRKRPKAALPALMREFYTCFLGLRALPQVSVALINGAAVGAGLCLALACDVRTVLTEARLALNFVRLGLNPGMAAWPLARAAFGDARARELLLTGRFFTGKDLHQWGAAAFAVDTRAELWTATDELARHLASQSWDSLTILKDEMRLGEDLGAFLELEAKGQALCFKGPDIAEGVAAAREKRAPKF
ncbi:MAG: enoyl-CoA hydratase/isomerase family protein [Elusimicrobia bacterium]|nr:enoyl-CoA hydratase/isomerase family protein [Elusimicrobiota bacterium]